MNKRKFTPISKIGEFKLIDHLTKDININKELTKVGIGDDAAVIPYLKNEDYLISTDMLAEGVHFDTVYTPLKHLGYKSIVVNISDICAMNGRATHALISIGIPNKYSVEHINELYGGIKMACKNYNIDLVGGDTTSSSGGMIISITVIGRALSNSITYRSGASPNDLLFVSGDLGGAYLGLQILEREKLIFNNNEDFQPELKNYEYILERQLKPEARIDVVDHLKQINLIPSSMIDLSDGLNSEIRHVCKSSNVGAKIFENKIPISDFTKTTAKELNIDPTVCALSGGEDYELLFTAPAHLHKKLKSMKFIQPIGHITSDSQKIELITSSGQSVDVAHEGWDTFTIKN